MNCTASITKRKRRRRLKSGATVIQLRFVVNFKEPRTGQRKQFFFERHKDALAKRDALLASVVTGSYQEQPSDLTVARAVEHWLESRRLDVKPATWRSYQQAASYVIGPLLTGTKIERHRFARRRTKREGAELVEMLGPKPIAQLTTADIRGWHKTLTSMVSSYTANVAKKFLRAALALTAEDFDLRVPPMPSQQGRGRSKPKKTILTPAQIGCVIKGALTDERMGIYYAFPFLTGVRPSEQLALMWQDVDFAAGVIRIRRMQEQDGSITEFTKTIASVRDIPMSPLLKTALLKWRSVCPRRNGELHRVFPRLGRLSATADQAPHGGGPLSYANFRVSYWRPALAALGLPYVTPHSARHAFISTLQAEGVEIGLVAKLAGHANATVTLSHYTQAVRGGEAAICALEKAFDDRRVRAEAPLEPAAAAWPQPDALADGEGVHG